MAVEDIGPKTSVFDMEGETRSNTNYRRVAWTGKYLQVTLMSIPVGGSIGLEVHPQTDQFLRLDGGEGLAKMGPEKDQLDVQEKVSDGWCALVPAGMWHDVENTGDEPMQLYVIYAPSHHASGKVQATKEDAERDEEAGTDEAPEWTVQPDNPKPDKTA